jgi:hypothetical protein
MEIRFPSKEELWARISRWRVAAFSLGWAIFIFQHVKALLDLKETVEEAVTTAAQIKPIFGVAVSVALSPWFGLVLILVCLGYIVFVPSSAELVGHPRLAVPVAWISAIATAAASAIFLILFAAVIASIAVSTIGAPRHLTQTQMDNFRNKLQAGPDMSERIFVVAFVSCSDCPSYAWDLAEQMNNVQNWKFRRFAPQYQGNGINVRAHGIVLAMADPSHLTDAAKAFEAAFKAAGIAYSIGQVDIAADARYPTSNVIIDTIIIVMPR